MIGLTDKEKAQLESNLQWWKDRKAAAQNNLNKKTVEQIDARLAKYYQKASARVMSKFIEVYNKVMDGAAKDIAPTPADLYKLESYWAMQAQLREELEQLGYKQIAYLNKSFTNQFIHAYEMVMDIDNSGAFSSIDKEVAMQLVNQIWAADGSTWSNRIWKNMDLLQDALNDELLQCVITGKNADDAKRALMEQFNVSYRRADTLVKTELTNIQTQAARKRYEDMGVKQVQVWAEKDERQCKICGKLHKTKYFVYEQMPIPAHPRCRCTIIPVIDGLEDD